MHPKSHTCVNPLLLAMGLFAPTVSLSAENNSLFVVDAPSLIAKAAEAIYKKRNDIQKNELIASPSMVSLNCQAQREIQLPVYSDTQCPAPRVIQSPCIADVNFPLRSTFKSDITVLRNGQCEVHFSYDYVRAEQLENGEIIVNMNSGRGSGSRQGDCTTIKPYLEVVEAIDAHQSALERELSVIQP